MVPNFVDYCRSEYFWNKRNTGVQERGTKEEMTIKNGKVIKEPLKTMKIKPTLGLKNKEKYLKKLKNKKK